MEDNLPTLITVEQMKALEQKLKPLIYAAMNNSHTLDEVILLIVANTNDWAECAVACFFAGRVSTEFE